MHLKKKIPQSALRQSKLRTSQEYQILIPRDLCRMCVCLEEELAKRKREEIDMTSQKETLSVVS